MYVLNFCFTFTLFSILFGQNKNCIHFIHTKLLIISIMPRVRSYLGLTWLTTYLQFIPLTLVLSFFVPLSFHFCFASSSSVSLKHSKLKASWVFVMRLTRDVWLLLYRYHLSNPDWKGISHISPSTQILSHHHHQYVWRTHNSLSNNLKLYASIFILFSRNSKSNYYKL